MGTVNREKVFWNSTNEGIFNPVSSARYANRDGKKIKDSPKFSIVSNTNKTIMKLFIIHFSFRFLRWLP